MFVWSDELALLLIDEGDATAAQLQHWIASPTGHPLPDSEEPLALGQRLLTEEAAAAHRRAS